MTGEVVTFDDQRGDGVFRADDGTEFYFHCVVIADGSRTIATGLPAQATRRVGLRGRDEVEAVRLLEV